MNLSEISDRDLHREQRRRRKLQKRRPRKAKGLGPRKKGMGCRIGLRDEEATKARKFLDPGSFVRSDAEGTEVCKGWRKIRSGKVGA